MDQRDPSADKWEFRRRFGMFLHWGIYAVGDYHEQHQQRLGLSREQYAGFAEKFNPTHFDPDAIVALARQCGMEYIVFTAKHHDGFCMWDSASCLFNVMKTPYGRDVLLMLAEACQRGGLKFGIYYSVVDWRHPNYPNEGRHHELPGPQRGDSPDMEAYVSYVRAQVSELCGGRYGPIAFFWWDMNVVEHVEPSINAMIRSLQPGILINNRGFDAGDYSTPEREWDEDARGACSYPGMVEACNSLGSLSWGAKSDDELYTCRFLCASIGRYLARGANYLLNLGPTASGEIDKRQAALLRRIGAWYLAVKEAFDATEPANELTLNRAVFLTRRDNMLYVLLLTPPSTSGVRLKPIDQMPRRAVLLNDVSEVECLVDMPAFDAGHGRRFLRLHNLDTMGMADTVPVIRMEFEQLPRQFDFSGLAESRI